MRRWIPQLLLGWRSGIGLLVWKVGVHGRHRHLEVVSDRRRRLGGIVTHWKRALILLVGLVLGYDDIGRVGRSILHVVGHRVVRMLINGKRSRALFGRLFVLVVVGDVEDIG
jgi:hypothetical protein